MSGGSPSALALFWMRCRFMGDEERSSWLGDRGAPGVEPLAVPALLDSQRRLNLRPFYGGGAWRLPILPWRANHLLVLFVMGWYVNCGDGCAR
ncbi:hypothetical protein GOP47_0018377 [Adiantum capillus-veneris]|uniref:Uncharacterized protein n=1 Tax=Adiantum capillus-veneris TaxID=13818 RepID=A0A9D4Z829_ADICA|nr:hypothetical protein GOP47_0018377 [Adiantum capillus-veneris]